MSVTTDIVQAWRQPKAVIRRHLQRPKSEPFAFSLLVAFLVVAFVSFWPLLSRQSVLQPEVPMVQRLVAAGLALLALIPFWYLLAAISHWIAKALGGQGGHYPARLALFSSLLAISPGLLLRGLVAGMIGPGAQLLLVDTVVGLCFAWIWIAMLREAERGDAG
ncbi:MAG: YIP1 family protein [Pseudorhodobacter sp. PARRP1]|nr:MAG: YIP1 family protein [Pseudorhodobacter sp. PARRP1]